MKKILALMLALVMALAMVSCGGSNTSGDSATKTDEPAASNDADGSSDAAEDSSTDVVTIDVWHSMEGTNGEAFEAMVAAFNDGIGKEKGIYANSVFQGSDCASKLKTLIQTNDTKNMPDVCLIYGASLPVVAEYEGTVPVDEMYGTGSASIAKEDIVPTTVQTFTYQGTQVCMPFNSSTILLYYNIDAFNEVGLDPDNPPSTMDELIAACEKLTVKDANGNVTRYGLNLQLSRYEMVNLVGNQGPEGTYFADNDSGRSGLITEITSADEILNVYKAWEKLAETGGLKYTYDNQNEEFATGISAMTIMSSARIGSVTNLTADSGMNWAVSYLPDVNEGDAGGTCVGGASLVMFDNGGEAEKAAAWEFIQYAASAETQATWSMATGYLPVNLGTKAVEAFAEHMANTPALQVALDQFESSNPNVQEPVMMMQGSVDSVIKEASVNVAEDTMTPEEATDYVVTECNKLFDEYNRANG